MSRSGMDDDLPLDTRLLHFVEPDGQDEDRVRKSVVDGLEEDGAASVPRAGFHYRGGSRLRVYRFEPPTAQPPRGAVVLLHGLLASHRAWEMVASSLARRGYWCYAADLLGFGESPWPRGSQAYNIDSHCDTLRRDVLIGAVLQDFPGPDAVPLHLVGHSLGGVLAIELASRHMPNGILLASVVTVALPFFASSDDAKATLHARPTCCCTRKPQKSWRAAVVWLVLDFPILSFLLCSLICQQRWFYVTVAHLIDRCRPLRTRRTRADKVADALNHSYSSVLASYRKCIQNHRLTPASLPKTLPILVAHGFKDDVIHHTCSRAFHSVLLESRKLMSEAAPAALVVLDSVTHSCHDSARPLALLLGRWLAGAERGLEATTTTINDLADIQSLFPPASATLV